MYQILIVDDEKFIRKSIRNRINWEEFNIVICGEASNGQEALELIAQIHPQIVLVDIKMPLMDGLTFIKEAQMSHPDISYIIMSAFDDFEYAKNAIRLGVEDYILKPVKSSELEAILKKIVHKLNQQKLNRYLQEYVIDDPNHVKLCRKLIVAVAFYIQNHDGAETMLQVTMNKALETLDEDYILFYIRSLSRGDCHVFLISGDSLGENKCNHLMELAWNHLGNIEGVSAYSEAMENWQIRNAITRSIHMLMRKMFYPERKIITVRQSASESSIRDIQQRIRNEMNILYQQLYKIEHTKVEILLVNMVELIICKENGIAEIENGIAEILLILKNITSQYAGDTEYNILFHGFQGRDYLLRYPTAEELKNQIKEVIRNCFCILEKDEDADVIVSIKQYIIDNYSSDLNAVEIAGRFYLNASYLSTLFKEKTGMNMGAYIEGVRMEHAQYFLTNTDWSITEVAAQCGYSESNYFSKVFKKYSGMTPRQYREKKEE